MLTSARCLGRRWARVVVASSLLLGCAVPISLGALALARQDDAGVRDCQSNLKQYALGILMYTQDYDERYPPMQFPAQVEHRVDPYVKNRALFRCPTSGMDYLPNPALSYLTLGKVNAPARMVMLRDAKPHTTEGGQAGWNVAYADGHVRLVSTEPKLGKPAPAPPRSRQISDELRALRRTRRMIDARIRQLEAEQRRLRRRR